MGRGHLQKRNGIYRPAGRLVLPMTVEGRNPDHNEGAHSVAFTIFEEEFFEGLSAPTPPGYGSNPEGFEFQALCDWCDSPPRDEIGVLTQTYTRSQNPYTVVRAHVANILGNLEKITEKARKAGVEHVVKRAFIEY
ncbi:MAG: hypothetical protein ABH864_01160 [archaeon]